MPKSGKGRTCRSDDLDTRARAYWLMSRRGAGFPHRGCRSSTCCRRQPKRARRWSWSPMTGRSRGSPTGWSSWPAAISWRTRHQV